MSSCDVTGYEELSSKIKDKLGLEKSPVAVKLVLREEDIPEGISKIDESLRHCEMVQKHHRVQHSMQRLKKKNVKVELQQ